MPIRAEPSMPARELHLPTSAERELRKILQDQNGILTEDAIREIQQRMEAASRAGEIKDSNDDVVGTVGECAVVADGSALLAVILDGIRRRIRHPIDSEERLQFTGENS